MWRDTDVLPVDLLEDQRVFIFCDIPYTVVRGEDFKGLVVVRCFFVWYNVASLCHVPLRRAVRNFLEFNVVLGLLWAIQRQWEMGHLQVGVRDEGRWYGLKTALHSYLRKKEGVSDHE